MWRISQQRRTDCAHQPWGALLGLLFSWQVWAELPPAVSEGLQAAGIPESHVALIIQDVEAATPQWHHGEHRSLNPASVMKLFTTLGALEMLGPAHTWPTRVWVDGTVSDGILHGDLILEGGGDPALTLERFWLLLREIRARGIREIRGNVVLDNQLYDLAPPDPGAFDNAPLQPYNAPPAALLVNYNALRLHVAAVDGRLQARLDPPALPVVVDQVEITSAPDCGDWDDALSLDRREDGLHISGQYPAVCGDRGLWLNLLAPEEHAAVLFRALWRELGGQLGGQVSDGRRSDRAYLLLRQDSPTLRRIVRDINEYSNNVMAKMLFLNLGIARHGGRGGWEKSQRALQEWLRARKLEMPELVIDNGAGLSRLSRVSAASLASLLQYAAGRPSLHDFAGSLPSLGKVGTLRKRMPDSPFAGRAWLKTGSLKNVRSLAGYVLDSCGRQRILVWLVNDPRAAASRAVQDSLIDEAIMNKKCPLESSANGI